MIPSFSRGDDDNFVLYIWLACVNRTLALCVYMFVYNMGGGRGPVHEQAPVHERLFTVCF